MKRTATLLLFLALLAASIVLNIWLMMRPAPPAEIITTRDTLWRDTTLQPPAPAETISTGRTLLVPYIITERDTIRQGDTIYAEAPVEQRRYDDSLYTAWVSGYQPTLDSIRLHQPTITEHEVITLRQRAPRWTIGPAIGAGISIDAQRHPGIYIGFTAQYRLWPK